VQTYIPNLYWKAKEVQKSILHDDVAVPVKWAGVNGFISASSSSLPLCLNPLHPVSLTTDLWSGPDHERYICFTVHWLDKDWVFKRALLDVYLCTERHLGENICDWVKQVLQANDISVCCVCLVLPYILS